MEGPERNRRYCLTIGGESFSLPDLSAPIADSHAHLDMLADPGAALARAAIARVELVVTVCDTESVERTMANLPVWLESAARLLAIEERPSLGPPLVKAIVGLHPHEARTWSDEAERRLGGLLESGRFSAVGEIGLDFHYNHSPRPDQRRAFRAQLALAHRYGLPAVMHLREAREEMVAALREVGVPEAGCVIHCFSEGPEAAEEFLGLGCYLSFAGPVTYPKSQEVREAARLTPLERLMVETDSPFLTPVPYRGRPNEPAFSVLNAASIAEAKGEPAASVAKAALANTYNVFGGRD